MITATSIPDHNSEYKKPYNSNLSDKSSFSPTTTKQPQSHSDILVRELGPSFGNQPSQNNSMTNSDGISNNRGNLFDLDRENNLFQLKNMIHSTAIVKYNYKSQQSDELSLTKGAEVTVLEKSDDGWWKGELNEKIGWFPSNYVIEQAHRGTSNQQSELKVEDRVPTVSLEQQKIALNPHAATTRIGDLFGRQTSQDDSSSRSAILKQPIDEPNHDNTQEVLSVVVALYSFQSQNEEELSFIKGEHLDIIEKPANDPDWWRACNQLGETGLVPKNYVQIVPKVKSIRSWSARSPMKKAPESNAFSKEVFETDSGVTQTEAIHPSENKSAKQSGFSSSYGDGNSTGFVDRSSLAQLAQDLEIKLNLNEKTWYHGVMSRQQCDQLLNAYAEDGDFLIRNSETSAGDFSVSLKAPIRNKHFRVHYVEDSFCIGQRKFDSLDELVEHYKRTPIYTSATGEKMFLKKAYCR